MASLNKVLLIGNLTRDPELRYTPSGTAVADLGLAVNERYTSREGKQVERTVFIDVVVWQRQAETASEYLSKGRPIFVEGRLQLDEWENQQGEKRTKMRVVAQNIQFLGARGEGGGQGGQGPRGARPAHAGTPRGDAPPDEEPHDVPGQDVGEDDIPF
ncbi:MAG: single-stranded DNA-binding protein [Verrucomicrobia bacterium]|nr:single-stranded DNA-binding protein [Verrucomicrobiota bacterium]